MATKPPPESYRKLWDAALEQEIGICIQCIPEDQQKLIAALYECRSLSPEYERLILMSPQPPGTIYLMKKTVELPG